MTKPSPAESEQVAAGAPVPPAWLRLLAKAEDSENEPLRFASPPCYLAEFSDVDSADPAAK